MTTDQAHPVRGYFWSRDGKCLGGRYQHSLTPAVAQRLAQIMVDPKTVTLVSATEG